MRITLRLILSLVLAMAVIFAVFSVAQTRRIENRLQEDLSLRAELVAGTLKAAIEPHLSVPESPTRIEHYLEQFGEHRRLLGTMVRLKSGAMISIPPSLFAHPGLREATRVPIDLKIPTDLTAEWKGKSVYFYSVPLFQDAKPVGSLSVIHDRSHIRDRVITMWLYYAVIFMIMVIVISATTLIIIRTSVTAPLSRISRWTKRVGRGVSSPHADLLEDRGEMGHLLFEVANMASSLKAKRPEPRRAGENRENFANDYWNRDSLKSYLKTQLGDHPLYVVANREPYMHIKTPKGVKCVFPPSGMVTALDPVLQATEGVWVAHGSGNADKESSDEHARVRVPPENPKYTLKRVWLSEKEEKGFYVGFSNEGIWPLCHIAHTRPVFRVKDWETYKKVNRKFADALLEELSEDNPYILIQDYHFALLPQYIKEKRPKARVALFWHIPWPNPEVFGICPWKEEILEGMLGSDLVSFHTQYHCNNFLDTVDRVLESRIDWDAFGVLRQGSTTLVRPFPISIDPFAGSGDRKKGEDPEFKKLIERYHLKDKWVGLGVDRIDYIKGLGERFIAIERLLEKYPKYRGKMVFVELGAPSRSGLAGYQSHVKSVERRAQKINEKYSSENYQPIVFLKDHHSGEMIRSFYRLADFCVVNSLHDGMNLVAKEFVAAKEDLNGALILSRFTGASLELRSALLVNPYDIEETADAMHQAMSMAPEERRKRMERMRETVFENNVYRWAAKLVTELVKSF